MSTELNKHMKKLKDMGVTINVTGAGGREPGVVSSAIKHAAQDAGIYYEKGDTPDLSPSELAEVTRFGIHEEDQEENR